MRPNHDLKAADYSQSKRAFSAVFRASERGVVCAKETFWQNRVQFAVSEFTRKIFYSRN
jgi:hypothetical protein